MIKKVNLQYLLSYLGIFPIVIIVFDDLFIKKIPILISSEFLIHYILIIFVFIGAINWNLKKELSILIICYGFSPSLLASFLITLNLLTLNKNIILIVIILFLVLQLVLDFIIIYKENKKPFFLLRLPLTILICISIVLILVL